MDPTPTDLTGSTVKDLRRALGVSMRDFAAIVGSSNETSVARWEATGGQINAHVAVDRYLRCLLALKGTMTPTQFQAFGRELSQALTLRGPLYALYLVLLRYFR